MKSAIRVFAVGCCKNHFCIQCMFLDCLGNFNSVDVGHVNIEKNKIRILFQQEPDTLLRTGCFGNNPDLVKSLKINFQKR